MRTKLAPYVRAALLTEIARDNTTLQDEFLPLEHISINLQMMLETVVPDEPFYEAFDLIMDQGGIEVVEDPIADVFYRINRKRCRQLSAQESADKTSLVFKYAAVGQKFLKKAVETLGDAASDEQLEAAQQTTVPASDRIVTLSHNQIAEIERPLSELIGSLEEDNGVPEDPGIRERLLGQIRAGRELIRVGILKTNILYVTLVRGLEEIITKYKDHAIGAAASVLIELLIKHIFGVTGE